MTTDRPRTIEEFRALPEGPKFGFEEHELTAQDRTNGYIIIRGKRFNIAEPCRAVCIPLEPELVSFYSEKTDIISVTDDDGCWMLGRYSDGTWFRQRH